MNGIAVSDAIGLLISLLNQSAAISAIIAKAQQEGRTTLTAEEWDAVLKSDDVADAALGAAIDKAKAEGR